MNLNIWYILCLLFLFFNLKTLVDDSYLISYITVEEENKLFDKTSSFLLCSPFKYIKFHNNLKTKPNEIKEVSVKQFLNHSILSIMNNFKNLTETFKLNQTYIYNLHVCFLLNHQELTNSSLIAEFIKMYYLRLFVFSKGKWPFFFENVLDKSNTFDTFLLKIHKQKVFGERYLKDSRCTNDEFKLSRFNCLNVCFKKSKGFKFALYDINDNEKFNLSFIEKNFEIDPSVYNFNKDEIEKCKLKCPNNNDCSYETINSVKIREYYHKNFLPSTKKIDLQTTTYTSFYSITDFWLQFWGLFSLFTKSSFTSTIPALISYLIKKLSSYNQKFNHFNDYFHNFIHSKIKFICFIFGIFFVLNGTFTMLNDHEFEKSNPNYTSILNFSTEIDFFAIFVCFPVQLLIDQKDQVDEFRTNQILESLTFKKLEQKTDYGIKLLERMRINLIHGNRTRKNFKYKLIKELVIFKNCTFDNNLERSFLSRCFRIEFTIIENKYRRLMPLNFIYFQFKLSNWIVYLIQKDQNFTSGLEHFKGEYYLMKVFIKNSKTSKISNCKNYNEDLKLNCRTKRSCIDRCVNEKFLKKYSQFTVYSVIHKNQFESYILERTNFSTKIDIEIERECFRLYNQTDCLEIYYVESFKTTYRFKPEELNLNLNFENILIKENEYDKTKVWLNIINLESIFFGINCTDLLLTLFSLLRKIFKLKWHQFYRYFIFLICLIGFMIHLYLVFKSIISNELVYNGYYSKLTENVLPNLIFCIPYRNENIDQNHKLNGNYLNTITRHLNFKSVFKMIKYLNKTHIRKLNIKKLNYSITENYRDEEIEFNLFFYLNMKCFEIKLKTIFTEDDYIHFKDQIVLELYFNKEFRLKYQEIYFLYKKSFSKVFSGIFLFNIANIPNRIYSYNYKLLFEQLNIERDDRYEILKSPLSLFRDVTKINDATLYLDELKHKFKSNYKLTTKDIMLESDELGDFDDEINDLLFEQFYDQKQNISDTQNTVSLNYNQRVFSIYTQFDYNVENNKKADFSFLVSFSARETRITNDDNFTKVSQSILNILSIWLNICILDLFNYIKIFINLINNFYKFMIYLKTKTKNNLIN